MGRREDFLRRGVREVRLGQAHGSWHRRVRGPEPLRRGHNAHAGEPGHPASVPRHLQQRLPALPRPGDAAGVPQDHRRVHLRSLRTVGRRLRVPALGPRRTGRRRAVPHPASHHRLHRRGHRPQEGRSGSRPRLRHRRLPHIGLQAHTHSHHQTATGRVR